MFLQGKSPADLDEKEWIWRCAAQSVCHSSLSSVYMCTAWFEYRYRKGIKRQITCDRDQEREKLGMSHQLCDNNCFLLYCIQDITV